MTDGLFPLLLDLRRATTGGRAAIEERQRRRLAQLVEYARAHSPFYSSLYRDMPLTLEGHQSLPVTDKKALMARFDEWATDRDITLAKAQRFSADPELIGTRFLERYTLVTTSGTTGTPGIFIIDDGAMRVTNAIMLRVIRSWLGLGEVAKIVAGGRRLAMVADIGHHSATSVAAARLMKSARRRQRVQVLSVRTPVNELVAQLNEFQPAVLAPYASMARLLASEQEAGRLHISPVLMALAAEGLPIEDYKRIAATFNATVGNSYAATECMFLSYSCEHDWLHVNADWVIVEPVDANHRPVSPGVESHTVLITNLANRVQPILRYDLGDSVVERPAACPCGNPLPAIRVKGRSADVLEFEANQGTPVAIPPLAFEIDHIPRLESFQIVQAGPKKLRVRLLVAPSADADAVWREVYSEITQLLQKHGLNDVEVERATEPPQQGAGGKFRTVIPISH